MAIPEFTRSITIRVPDDVRSKLETLSQEQQRPLSRVVRAVIAAGLQIKSAPDTDSVELKP